jgi:hypothetical protein
MKQIGRYTPKARETMLIVAANAASGGQNLSSFEPVADSVRCN